MPTTCDIQFANNAQAVYYGGQLLSGTARLTLTNAKTVHGIFVRMRGVANCHWTETESYEDRAERDKTKTKSFAGTEEYLNEKTYFVGGDNDRIELAPGSYNHTFQCQLPPGLPTSVEGEHGHIRYSVEVILNISMGSDEQFERSFTVIKLIDLNIDPMMREPAVEKYERIFLPWGFISCWPMDPLKIEVLTPVKGYTPGQTINVTLTVDNESDVPLSDFIVEFIKDITYFAHEDASPEPFSKTEEICINSQTTDDGCICQQKKIFPVNLTVPPISPTDFTTSSVIKVKHYIKVTASIDDCCRADEHVYLPITIGTSPILDHGQPSNGATISFDTVISNQPLAPPTVPLDLYRPTEPSAPNAWDAWHEHNETNEPTELSAPSGPSLLNQDPPTYEEAIGGTGSKFKPKYPMYKRVTSYSIDVDGSGTKEK